MKQLVSNFLFCLTLIDVHSTFYYCPLPLESTFQEFKYLQNAYDITGLDIYWHYKGSDAHGDDHPFLASENLFDITCKNRKTFTIPSLNETIWRPDQIVIKVLDRMIVENMTYYGVFREDYTKWMAKQVGLGSLNYGAGYEPGYLERDQKRDLLKSGQVIVEASILVHLFNVTVDKTKFKLDGTFKDLIQLLTKPFEENPHSYRQFLDAYGTHFIETATFGGRTSIKYFVDSETYFEKQSQIDELIKSDFNHYSATLIKGDQSTIPGLKSRQYFQVGTFWTYIKETLNQTEWLKHLPRDPSIVGCQLKPITELIDNESIKTEVQKAVKYRMAKAFLDEIDDVLTSISVSSILPSAYFKWILFPYVEIVMASYNASLDDLISSCQHQLDTNDDNLQLSTTDIVKYVDLLRGSSSGNTCIEKLRIIFPKSIDLAAQKWKLPNEFKTKESCCAMYDAMNWVLNYTDKCSFCTGYGLSDLQVFDKSAIYALSKSLCSTMPHDKYSEMCTQNGTEFQFTEICFTKPKTTPFEHTTSSSHFKTWAIVLIVVLILTSAIIILICLYLDWQFPKQKHTLPVLKSEAPLKEDFNNQMKTSSLQVELKQEKSQVKSQISKTN